MKTTLDIDKDLVDEAKSILGTRTLRETVEHSLRAVVRQKALDRLAASAGSIELDLTVPQLRKQRKRRTSGGTR
jgi:Arc/MetJ family transcription regulator